MAFFLQIISYLPFWRLWYRFSLSGKLGYQSVYRLYVCFVSIKRTCPSFYTILVFQERGLAPPPPISTYSFGGRECSRIERTCRVMQRGQTEKFQCLFWSSNRKIFGWKLTLSSIVILFRYPLAFIKFEALWPGLSSVFRFFNLVRQTQTREKRFSINPGRGENPSDTKSPAQRPAFRWFCAVHDVLALLNYRAGKWCTVAPLHYCPVKRKHKSVAFLSSSLFRR